MLLKGVNEENLDEHHSEQFLPPFEVNSNGSGQLIPTGVVLLVNGFCASWSKSLNWSQKWYSYIVFEHELILVMNTDKLNL